MGTRNIQTGRHRLGRTGTVHCVEIREVASALAEYRRSWITALISPARHSLAAIRKRTADAAAQWVPATAS
ncbi:hypothetical protein BJY24_006694 [Nocardia transvalensis]|uniref:Uncharacterized protein n=1 Tax=Nocardia transvalensis TaxID=37333 RepID=A0A7W9PKD5_9NOCA|nr:hypothetical protein [Nocardia transvalensis]MBB5917782.1 hypothetical protein [Nocardia transvalensis]